MPDVFKQAVAPLKRTRRELETVRRLAIREHGDPSVGQESRDRAAEVLAAAELTYLLRLFSAFEASLTRLGPILRVPRVFTDSDSLSVKLEGLASDAELPTKFRDEVDLDLRLLRNELSHGNSMIPRQSFEHVYELMRAFIRGLS